MTETISPVLPLVARPWLRRATTGAGIAAALAVVVTADDHDVVLCPFRRCTGGYCPGCGGTRAAGRLLRGDIGGAWQQHPFVVMLAAQLVLVAGLGGSLSWESSTMRTPSSEILVRSRWWVPFTVANAVLMVAVWAVRLAF